MKVNGHINGKRDSQTGLSCFITSKQSSSKATTNFIINQLWLKRKIHQERHAARPPLTDLLAADRRISRLKSESPILAVNATQGNTFSRVKPEWLPHKLLFLLYLKRERNPYNAEERPPLIFNKELRKSHGFNTFRSLTRGLNNRQAPSLKQLKLNDTARKWTTMSTKQKKKTPKRNATEQKYGQQCIFVRRCSNARESRCGLLLSH